MTFGALNNEVVGSHTQQEWETLVLAWGFRCFYCGRPVQEDPEKIWDCLTRDHLVPLSRGGVDFIWNIVPACFNCNRLKGNQTVDEFRSDRPVFFTPVHEARRKSFEVDSLGEKSQPPVSNFAQQAIATLAPRFVMDDRTPEYYQQRRELLQNQKAEILRLRQVESGQLTLPIFGDDSPRKLMETAESSLPLKGMHVTDCDRRKA